MTPMGNPSHSMIARVAAGSAPTPDARGDPRKVDQSEPWRERAECRGSPLRKMSRRRGFSGRGDDVFERLAVDEAVDVAGNITRTAIDGCVGTRRTVRRHDNVWQFVEWVAGGARLRVASARIAPPGVERRSGDYPIAQGAVKRLLVGDRAARQIDQKGAGLHRAKSAFVDQTGRLGG